MKITIVLVFVLSLLQATEAQNKFGHVIQTDKQLSKSWEESLLNSGKQQIYRGEELRTIGMPCGGIAAGQLYVRGDGTLACWWIANNAYNTGYGIDHLLNFETAQGPWKVCYQTFEPYSYFEQGFQLKVKTANKTIERRLDKNGFDNIGFIGEYPVAKVLYEDKKEQLPVSIELEVFSPFIPNNAKESATPGTILKFRFKNEDSRPVELNLEGYLENMVMADLKDQIKGKIRNQAISKETAQTLLLDFIPEDATLTDHPYYGNMSLSLLSNVGTVKTDFDKPQITANTTQKELGEELVGSVGTNFKLQAGEEKEVTFLLSWFFPNRPLYYGDGGNWNKAIPTEGPAIGNMYANWFNSSLDVRDYLISNLTRLSDETYLFHNSWYNESNLPYWLKQRIMMPVSTLATETCQWWSNDKFWAWEGVGSCVGTCTHVYNYEQAIAFLFPELERNIREKTDFGTSFNEDGSIDARNGWGTVLLDGHIGAILKTYREYLISDNQFFLTRNWNKVKQAMQYAIEQDGNADGLIEGSQSNTYDISFVGANSYVGGLYLAALRAAEEMALIMKDEDFASECRTIFESGKELSVQKIWNGEYFFQDVDLEKHPKFQYANGCLSDQLFGQTWAHLLNLGYIYPEDKVKTALNSIWKYNWTMDVGPHITKFIPERYYANEGEPGLLNCTWPISEHLNENAVRYRNEVWTGIEYQVATNMIYDGMIQEGLSLVKAIHERYRPEKHNPWNEIECGDHYARALASWGVLVALEDFYYNGPQGVVKYAPKVMKDDFKGVFMAANGWGLITQKRERRLQENEVQVNYGKLAVQELHVELPGSDVTTTTILLNNEPIAHTSRIEKDKIVFSFEKLVLSKNESLKVRIKYNN